MKEWLFLNAKWSIIQQFHGEKKLQFWKDDDDDDDAGFVLDQHA